MHQLEIERGNHVFPVVVVCRHEDNALPLLVVFVHHLSVNEMITVHDGLRACIEIVQSLYQQVANVVVVCLLYLFTLLVRTVGIGVRQVCARHLATVAHQMVDHKIDYFGQYCQT